MFGFNSPTTILIYGAILGVIGLIVAMAHLWYLKIIQLLLNMN